MYFRIKINKHQRRECEIMLGVDIETVWGANGTERVQKI